MSSGGEGPGKAGEPVLILVHGLMSAHRMWVPQLESLGQRCSLVVPDLPGYGASPGPFSLDEAAGRIASLMAGHDEVHVCGLSLGAMVALRAAAREPGRVASLILSGVQVHPPALLCAVQRLVMKLVPAAKFSAGDPDVRKDTVLAVIGELARADLRGDLSRITARTLVICGSADRVNLGAARAAAAGITGAELRVIPGAGHVWNLQQPEVFNRIVGDWVSLTSAGGA